MSVSGHLHCLEIFTFSIIYAKPGRIAKTLLILALPSSHSLWHFPMSVFWFTPYSWWCSGATQHLERPLTPRLLMNAPKASWMTCAMHGMWLLIAGHMILEQSTVDCSSWGIEQLEEALSVVIPGGTDLSVVIILDWFRVVYDRATCTVVLVYLSIRLSESQWV